MERAGLAILEEPALLKNRTDGLSWLTMRRWGVKLCDKIRLDYRASSFTYCCWLLLYIRASLTDETGRFGAEVSAVHAVAVDLPDAAPRQPAFA